MEIEIRPATAADFDALRGRQPEYTTRALAVVRNGCVAALAGITIGPSYVEAFSEFDGAEVPKRTIWRYAKLLKEFIAAQKLPVIAIADPKRPRSGRFLESLGFHYAGEFNNEKVYRLKPWKQPR